MKKSAFASQHFLKVYVRFRHLLWLDGVMALIALLAISFLGLMVSDAIFIFSVSFRRAAFWLLGFIGLLYLALRFLAIRPKGPLHLARRCENHDPSLGSSLSNALQLANQVSSGGVTEVLRRQALEYGAKKAQDIRLTPLLGPSLKRTGTILTVVLLIFLGGFIIFESFFHSVIPRFFDPSSDHPPYSRLRLELSVNAHAIVYGDSCEIRATAEGSPVDELFLVTGTENGEKKTVMFRRPDGSYFFTLTSLRTPTTLWVTNGRARSKYHQLTILPTPIIKEINVTTEFPEYTGLSPLTTSLADLKGQLPKRSKLNFTIRSNRPLKGGILELTPLLGGESRSIPLLPTANPSTSVTGGFTLEKPTAFSLNIVDIDKRLSQNPAKGRVTISADRPPRIFIEEPGNKALATPEIKIPIRVRCEDDYGVSSVRIFRGYNQSIEYPVEMEHKDNSGSRGMLAEGSFDFSDLGVRPGDLINYYLEAIDNNPEGPGLSLSRMYSIQIISEKQYRHIVKNLQGRKKLFGLYFNLGAKLNVLVRRAQAFNEQLGKLSEAGKPADHQTDLCFYRDQFQSSMREYGETLNTLIENKPGNDVEVSFHTRLYATKLTFELLQKQFQQMSAETTTDCKIDAQKMTALLHELTRMGDDVEREVLKPAEEIAAVIKILSMADNFAKMAGAQMELSALAHRFRDKTTPPTRLEQLEMSELNARQEKLRLDLSKFTRQLAELLDALPKEEQFLKLRASTEQFLQAVDKLDIQTDLNQAVENWQELKGNRAYIFCKTGAEKMQKLLQHSGDIGQQGKACLQFMPIIKNGRGNALEQLLHSMQGLEENGSDNDGYGMYDENVGLYGPDVQLPGTTEEYGDGDEGSAKHSVYRIEGTERDNLTPEKDKGPKKDVKLIDGVEFPLRYRQLVGDYFKAIAESEQKETGK